MYKFFTTSFIALALVVSAAGVAHAQFMGDPNAPDQNAPTAAEQSAANMPGISTPLTNSTTGLTPSQKSAAAGSPAQLPPDPTDVGKGFGSVMTWIMSLFAWLVGVAALTLNYAVYYTVITMGDYVKHLSAVGVTWRILRDIGNIMFIFGFLAVGITTILNVDWYGVSKKMLPMLLVGAIFINFSLFFAEAIIDTGNLFATQFYTQINGGVAPTLSSSGLLTTASGNTLTPSNEGISNKIMGQMGFQTIYSTENPNVLKSGSKWIIAFMGIILFLVTAFVMFSLAFILIFRFVALIFLIIAAPLGFAGLAIPGFANLAKKWWTNIFEQTITAPILLLMLYIALAVITDAQFLTGFRSTSKGWLGLVDNASITNYASVLLSFLVAMGLLLLVVVYAKKWSAFGGDLASRMGAKLSFGATAWGMRKTVGAGSQALSQRIRRSNNKFIGGNTKVGRILSSGFDLGAKGSFDMRGTGVLKKIPLGSQVDAGEAQKGGYRKTQEDTIKGHEEYAKSIGKAIRDRGASGEEEKAKKEAEERKESAQQAKAAATNKQNDAKQRILAQSQEIERLRGEQEKNAFPDPAIEAQIDAAQKSMDASKASLEAANLEKKAAEEKIDAAEKEVKAAEGGVDIRAKESQMKYAKNITNSPVAWVAFGSGGNAAAKKIIKDAKKTKEEKFREDLQKAVEQAEAGGGSVPTAPTTPAAPAVPATSTGGAGGGGHGS